MESLLKDIRYGMRGLWKRPAFTLIAIITLALGIGANTAIFTLINAVLLKNLPVNKPEALVLFNDGTSEGTRDGDPGAGQWDLFSSSSYRYFRSHNQSFQDLAALRSGEARVSVRRAGTQDGAISQRASAHLVSGNYFSVLGVGAFQGRILTDEDDMPNARPVAVLSYGYWQQSWNGDQNLIGADVLLNGTSFTVVGVMPPQFFGERVRRSPDYWVPLNFQPQIELREAYVNQDNVYWLNLMGRLRPSVSMAQAEAGVNLQLRQFLTDQAGAKLTDERRRGIANTYVQLASGARGISGLRAFYAGSLKLLMVIVLLVLLMACANVGNLLLSRGAARHSEMALRQALGASRVRLIRQLLTESLLLAIIGGVAGIMLAQWAVKILVSLVAQTAPLDVGPDVKVLAFTALISLISGMLFGIAPAIRATRSSLTSALKEKATQGRHNRFGVSLGSALVVSQVALSLVLLVGAGLFARSLINLQQVDLGFNRENVLLLSVEARLAGYKPTELTALYRQLYDRLTSLPQIRSVTIATETPMGGRSTRSSILVRGYTAKPGEDMVVSDVLIGPNYTATLGLPLIQGRDINLQDTVASTKVGLVNQTFAEYYFANQNPLGRHITFDENSDKDDLEIVGVIGDARFRSAKEKAVRAVYRPILQVQEQHAYNNVIQLRTDGNPLNLAGPVRQAIAQVDSKLPITDVTSLRAQTEEALKQEKLMAQLVSFFSLLALVLACIGLYGIMGHAVVRRTNEIGIRMALGAARGNIIWMVLRECFVLVLVGIAIGIPVALAAGRLAASQLFGLGGADPLTLVISAAVLVLVATLAGYLPARRASRVDPLIALRYE